ncbi:MAG: hypothetical protein JW990_04940, partial [Thermoleophilia bacterium]|nr:hypothetical protein [Thermoleophilia bacterium]
ERPYRRLLTTKQAQEELLRVAGSQLDPVLVEVFVELLRAKVAAQAEPDANGGRVAAIFAGLAAQPS